MSTRVEPIEPSRAGFNCYVDDPNERLLIAPLLIHLGQKAVVMPVGAKGGGTSWSLSQ
jgi:hypothetical protein